MRWFPAFLSVVCALIAFGISPAVAEKRVALVVGMSSYRSVAPLNNPANDARLMAETLRGLGYTLVGGGPQLDLDKAGLERVVQNFGSQSRGADYALFYYSGHGIQLRGANYLVPIDAKPTSVADVGLQMTDVDLVLRQMEAAGTRVNMVLLDACRNNPFGERGLRAMDIGLAQMQAPEGTVIAYATEPGSVAADDPQFGNSPYTKALAQTIRQPRRLKILDALNEVGLVVMRDTARKQKPWFSASPLQGDVYIGEPQNLPAATATWLSPPSSQQAAIPPSIQPVPDPSIPAPATSGQPSNTAALKCALYMNGVRHDWSPAVVKAACEAEAPEPAPYAVGFPEPLSTTYYNCYGLRGFRPTFSSGSERIKSCTEFIQSDLKAYKKNESAADRADAYLARGWAYYYYEKDYQRAIADFNEAIRLKGSKHGIFVWTVYQNRGYAYYRDGDNDRAIADFSQAIRLYPNNPAPFNYAYIAYFGRGIAYAAKGDGPKAKADLDMGDKLKPK
jgi:tetratricopeptide (TPR) repeat protein